MCDFFKKLLKTHIFVEQIFRNHFGSFLGNQFGSFYIYITGFHTIESQLYHTRQRLILYIPENVNVIDTSRKWAE